VDLGIEENEAKERAAGCDNVLEISMYCSAALALLLLHGRVTGSTI
jgi:hypothetical protein